MCGEPYHRLDRRWGNTSPAAVAVRVRHHLEGCAGTRPQDRRLSSGMASPEDQLRGGAQDRVFTNHKDDPFFAQWQMGRNKHILSHWMIIVLIGATTIKNDNQLSEG